jgi:hypothetical protein
MQIIWPLFVSVLPDQASMYLAAINDEEMHAQRVGYWDDVYGLRRMLSGDCTSCIGDISLFVMR